MSICFFIGHRDASADLLGWLEWAIERHIYFYGVTDFYVGHYGNFDSIAASAVKAAKMRHSAVTLTMLLPYRSYTQSPEALEGFDGTFCPPEIEKVPWRYAIPHANRHMVTISDYLIAYDKGSPGNTHKLVAFAGRREKQGKIHVENIANMWI